jgi:RNA recognition motif-containing protein
MGEAKVKKLFVGGLSWNTTEEGLREAFAGFGEVTEVRIITDRDTGRSRGFGFVSFTTDEAASQAMEQMDNARLDGRMIRVSEAKEKPRRGGGRHDGGRQGGRY